MRLIDADRLERKIQPNKHYNSDEIKAMIADMPTIAESPSTPLSLEDLQELDGEPVWMKVNDTPGRWGIVSVQPVGYLDNSDYLIVVCGYIFDKFNCGITHFAYCSRPDE